METISKYKKVYSRPELEVIDVDHEISLIMISKPEDPPPFSASETAPPSESSPVSKNPPSFENDPFGGDSPDYSN